MSVEKQVLITVNLRKHDRRTMILRQGMAEGTDDGEPFGISYSLSNGDLVYYFSKEARYTVSLSEITEAVLKAREEVLKMEEVSKSAK